MPHAVGTARARLFTAAAELIGERGFHGTTVDDIAELAGVAKGTVYYHFKNKEALFDALLTEHFSRLGDAFRTAVANAAGPADALGALVRTELEYIHANQAASKLLMSEVWRSDRAWQETLRPLRERYVAAFRDVLDAGVASHAFRQGLDAPLAASALFGMVATAALDWLVFDPDRDAAEITEAVVALALRAVTG